jgi:hypothetical protein
LGELEAVFKEEYKIEEGEIIQDSLYLDEVLKSISIEYQDILIIKSESGDIFSSHIFPFEI